MKTIILCGGTGTRLKEETEYKPKQMVYVANKLVSWHIMKIYASYGYNEFTEYLEKNKIGTRNIFSGNLLRHPAYLDLKYKTAGKIVNADIVMKNAFWLGVYPGIDKEKLEYVKKIIVGFLK